MPGLSGNAGSAADTIPREREEARPSKAGSQTPGASPKLALRRPRAALSGAILMPNEIPSDHWLLNPAGEPGTLSDDEDDAAILALLPQLRGQIAAADAVPEHDDERYEAETGRIDDIEEAIFKVPAGARGMAVKLYALARREFCYESDGTLNVGTEDGVFMCSTATEALRGLLADAARHVPELAPLVAAIIARPPDSKIRATCEAIAAAYEAPLPEGDEGLLAAIDRWRDLAKREYWIYDLQPDKAAPVEELIDPARSKLAAFIADTKPQTVAAAAAKLRLMVNDDWQGALPDAAEELLAIIDGASQPAEARPGPSSSG